MIFGEGIDSGNVFLYFVVTWELGILFATFSLGDIMPSFTDSLCKTRA